MVEFYAEPLAQGLERSPYYYEVELKMAEPGLWDTQDVLFGLSLCMHNCTHFCDVKVVNKESSIVFGCRPFCV